MSIAELKEIEASCIARFQQKAAEIAALNPRMSASVALARAVSLLPKTCEKYQNARRELEVAGVLPQLLR